MTAEQIKAEVDRAVEAKYAAFDRRLKAVEDFISEAKREIDKQGWEELVPALKKLRPPR